MAVLKGVSLILGKKEKNKTCIIYIIQYIVIV